MSEFIPTPYQQRVIRLYVRGYGDEEIAEEMGVTFAAAHSAIYRIHDLMGIPSSGTRRRKTLAVLAWALKNDPVAAGEFARAFGVGA